MITLTRTLVTTALPGGGVLGRVASHHAISLIACSMLGIGLVSAYDFYVTIITAGCLPDMEKNEFARRIMGLDNNVIASQRIAFFLALKFAGTVLVLVILGVLGMTRDRRAVPVALGVLTFQLCLLYVLCDPGHMR